MTDDLKERLHYGTVDPVTGEPLDPGVYAHVAHEDITEALARITDLEGRLAAADKQRRESDEKLTNQRHEINWLKEQQQALKDSLAASEDKLYDAQSGPWPQWAASILTCLKDFGWRFDDLIDLPDELENYLRDYPDSAVTGLQEQIDSLSTALAAAEGKLTEWQSSQSYRYIGRDGKPVLARDLEARAEAAEAEVQRCHERLEITHVWRMKPGAKDLEDLERIDVPMDERASMPDAVACRDATIALLEEDIEDLRAARDAAEADNRRLIGNAKAQGILDDIGAAGKSRAKQARNLAFKIGEQRKEIRRLKECLAATKAKAEERHALHLEQVRITNEWIARADAAEAGEDALAGVLREAKLAATRQYSGELYPSTEDGWEMCVNDMLMAMEVALAAHEARRKGCWSKC